MRGKSQSHGGSLTDSELDHAGSFPVASRQCVPAAVTTESGPAAGPGREGATEVHTAVDGGRLRLVPGDGPTVVFLHGAGSGVDTPLFNALATALAAGGARIGRLEMPYRVAGRRAPDRAARLDAVALAAVSTHVADTGRPFALAGVSMGSRVAMRVAGPLGARGVLALGFPLRPPGRTAAGEPKPSRQHELDEVGLPVLVVQGERDPFGRPEPDASRERRLHLVRGGDHSFRTRVRDGRAPEEAVAEAAHVGAAYLLGLLGLLGPPDVPHPARI
nr:alpha/beta family hydrolase [Candidatus Frankia nodulisporulans]